MVLKKTESYWSTLENTKEPIQYCEIVIREKESNIDLLSYLNHTSRLPNRDEGSYSLQSVSSVTQSCPTLCNPMDCSTPGLLVHHQLPESTQTHVHCVSDAIQPSTISSSVVPFSSCLQSFPALAFFQMSQFFSSSGQIIGVLASTSVPPMNTQDWSPSGWTGWISFQSKGLSRLLQHHKSKVSIIQCLAFFRVQLSNPYMTTEKTIALSRRTFVGKVMSLPFNKLSIMVITFCIVITLRIYSTKQFFKISCLVTWKLPWFMDLTFQFPMQYYSLQHRTLLPSPVTSATGCGFCFGFVSAFFLELLSTLLQ